MENLGIDFVAESSEGLSYYQVASTVRDNSVLKRELTPMQMIHDHYPKMLLTLDDDPPSEYNGIRKKKRTWMAGWELRVESLEQKRLEDCFCLWNPLINNQ